MKTIKVLKIFCVKCPPVTDLVKRIAIFCNNRCVFKLDMETITDLGDQWIQNILNKIDTK